MHKEIERKFLIKAPSADVLKDLGAVCSEIEQTYLCATSEYPTRRVRRRSYRDHVSYTYTAKRPAGGNFTRDESEREITEDEYNELLLQKESGTSSIRKKRYCAPASDGHILEIDLFDFWSEYAVLEIELTSEEEGYAIPDCINVIKEVTDDPRFLNVSLARAVPNIEVDVIQVSKQVQNKRLF